MCIFRLKHMAIVCVMASSLGIGFAATAADSPPEAAIDDALIQDMKTWLETPVVQLAVAAQNKRYANLKQSDIDALDKQWRAETKVSDQPLITAVLANPLSSYLTRIQAGSAGLYTEIFVTDTHGLNAGQSAITSDYWQGDEAKFQKTYAVGANAVFVDEAEFEEKSATWRRQVNLTVHDQAGKPMGAATVEINVTELARRQAFKK